MRANPKTTDIHPEPEILVLPEADLRLVANFLEPEEADHWTQTFIEELQWGVDRLVLFGREVEARRRVAFYGEPEASYRYSGADHVPLPWAPSLNRMRRRVESVSGHRFNCVLANLYRDGSEAMGWHSDDERELGPEPVIASLSLGGQRRMGFRHKQRAWPSTGFDLPSGSLLIMSGPTQHRWQHCLRPTRRPVEPRVNLTFRTVLGV